jgi:hypothetical protein
MKKLICLLSATLVLAGCSGSDTATGVSNSSSSTTEVNQCTSPTSTVVDYGFRRTSGAALNVRGAFSDIALIPGTNYPGVVFGETTTTVGINTLKYQYWNGSEFKIEVIAGGLITTYVRLVYLSTGRPLVFWGNGLTGLYMAARSTNSTSAEGTWTVTLIDGSSVGIRSVEASVNPADQVMVAYVVNTATNVEAAICQSNCHLAANYTPMTAGTDLDAVTTALTTQMGVGWCKHSTGYYPMVLYSDAAAAVLTMCRDANLTNCNSGTNWATDITLTGSGATTGSQLYVDNTTVDATVYMAVKAAGGIRPYTYATCATNVAVVAADPGTNFVSATATVGNAWFNLGFGDGTFHVVANDGVTMVKYFNQPTATFATGVWRAAATPFVETTGAAGLAAASATRGGMAVDTTGDQVLLSYGRTLAVTPTQTFGNVVLAYNDCPSGLGAPACSSTTLASDASSTAMYWGNMPLDGTGQVQRNSLQVPNTDIATTSAGRPAAVYIDYSIGISAEPATGALLKYAYRNGATASSRWIVSTIPTTSAPASPDVAFDHQGLPWVSWFESAGATPIGFRAYLATNSREDGTGLWTVYAFPLLDAAGANPTLPVMNQTSVVMHWSGGIAKPVMIVSRNPTASKGVHAARFNPATNAWENQQQIIAMAGTTTPGSAWLSADSDTSGNIVVAVHDMGTTGAATCVPITSRCVRTTYSTDGGRTWATAGQIYSGGAEGLRVRINPATSRPAISFYNKASNTVRYKYCSSALASCTSAGNWSDIGTGVLDPAAGVSTLAEATNPGLLSTGLDFTSTGYPAVTWARGSTAPVSPDLMFSMMGTTGTFGAAATLKLSAYGNESTPGAAVLGNLGLNWSPSTVRASTGSLHTAHSGPGGYLYVTSCGD